MNRFLRAMVPLAIVTVAACSAAPQGGAIPSASAPRSTSARAMTPLDRQTLGASWGVYASSWLEHTWVFTTAGTSIVGASSLENRLEVFDPATGAVSAFVPAAAGGIAVSEPLTAVAGNDGYIYFTAFAGSPALGRFTVTSPPVFSYCTLPAAPTSALTQDPATGAIYVGDKAGYVDTVTWTTGACSVSATRFQDPEAGGYPFALVIGWDGHVFLGDISGHIVEISNGVLVHDYAIANAGPVARYTAYDLTGLLYDAKDNQIWFSSPRNVQIGRLASNGTIGYFYVAGGYNVGYGTSPQSLIVGPDGNIWAAVGYDKVWTVAPYTASGTTATALTPPTVSAGTNFTSITMGPDRQVYVTDVNTDLIYTYNYLSISTSVPSVTLAKGASATVTVKETHYTGKLTVTSSKPSVIACAIVQKVGKYRLSLRWKHAGKASIKIEDSYGNSALLPVVGEKGSR